MIEEKVENLVYQIGMFYKAKWYKLIMTISLTELLCVECPFVGSAP